MDQLGRLPLRVYSIDKYAFQKSRTRIGQLHIQTAHTYHAQNITTASPIPVPVQAEGPLDNNVKTFALPGLVGQNFCLLVHDVGLQTFLKQIYMYYVL